MDIVLTYRADSSSHNETKHAHSQVLYRIIVAKTRLQDPKDSQRSQC